MQPSGALPVQGQGPVQSARASALPFTEQARRWLTRTFSEKFIASTDHGQLEQVLQNGDIYLAEDVSALANDCAELLMLQDSANFTFSGSSR